MKLEYQRKTQNERMAGYGAARARTRTGKRASDRGLAWPSSEGGEAKRRCISVEGRRKVTAAAGAGRGIQGGTEHMSRQCFLVISEKKVLG